MFIDVAKIYLKAGKGGNGKVSFHREKYVANGGPDGGDGGKGGDIVFVIDNNLNTLVDFKYKRKFIAQDGENGGSKRCSGKKAPDLIIKVPKGTLIKDANTGLVIKDMSDDKPFVIAKGGNGGWGNTHFATPTRQAPQFAKSGELGAELEVVLELKLLADVGLLGFPNVGKSTFLSIVSAARPKIANYHFTTITPNLGVVAMGEGNSFVMADIPGIIEGASEGVGLGHAFLRHVDRCRLLVHIVDISGSEGRNPVEDFEAINNELAKYSPELATRPQIVVGNKTDIVYDSTLMEDFEKYIKEKGYDYFTMSAATRNGTEDIVNKIYEKLQSLPPVTVYESEASIEEYVPNKDKADKSFDVEVDGNFYIVTGNWLINLIGSVNFDDYESLQYFQRQLRNNGVIDKLVEKGIKEGDIVSIYDIQFEYRN